MPHMKAFTLILLSDLLAPAAQLRVERVDNDRKNGVEQDPITMNQKGEGIRELEVEFEGLLLGEIGDVWRDERLESAAQIANADAVIERGE